MIYDDMMIYVYVVYYRSCVMNCCLSFNLLFFSPSLVLQTPSRTVRTSSLAADPRRLVKGQHASCQGADDPETIGICLALAHWSIGSLGSWLNRSCLASLDVFFQSLFFLQPFEWPETPPDPAAHLSASHLAISAADLLPGLGASAAAGRPPQRPKWCHWHRRACPEGVVFNVGKLDVSKAKNHQKSSKSLKLNPNSLRTSICKVRARAVCHCTQLVQALMTLLKQISSTSTASAPQETARKSRQPSEMPVLGRWYVIYRWI